MPNTTLSEIDRIKSRLPEGWEHQADTSTFDRARRFLLARGWREFAYDVFEREVDCVTARVKLFRESPTLKAHFAVYTKTIEWPYWSYPRDEDYSLADMPYVLIDNGLMDPECPNCGEAGGQPVYMRSREWQGCAEHGGMVTHVDAGCSKCLKEEM